MQKLLMGIYVKRDLS